jgi:hypothetical protein
MERNEVIATIRALPDGVTGLVGELAAEQLRRHLSPGEWSVLEICCHLRDDGEISTQRIQRLATEDNPAIEGYDEAALAAERNYGGDDIARVLPALRAAWAELAQTLEQLPPDAWQRAGSHPERGALTLGSEAQDYANHAHEHTAQLRAMRERLTSTLS